MTASHDPSSLVDLDRYPIDRTGAPEWHTLVERCRRMHETAGAANLEGFIRTDAIGPLAAEASALLEGGYRKTYYRTALFGPDTRGLPDDHPAKRQWQAGALQVADDQIGPAAMIRAIYAWQPLTDFIAAVEERPKLYLMADEFQALNVIAHREGELLPWHYDFDDFTVTLLLQASEEGGDFVFVPDLRTATDPNYDTVRRIFDGDRSLVKVLPRAAGTLTLFRGRNSLHSVSPIVGPTPRVTAIMTYDERPDCVAPEDVNVMVYGPRAEAIYRRRKAAGASLGPAPV